MVTLDSSILLLHTQCLSNTYRCLKGPAFNTVSPNLGHPSLLTLWSQFVIINFLSVVGKFRFKNDGEKKVLQFGLIKKRRDCLSIRKILFRKVSQVFLKLPLTFCGSCREVLMWENWGSQKRQEFFMKWKILCREDFQDLLKLARYIFFWWRVVVGRFKRDKMR